MNSKTIQLCLGIVFICPLLLIFPTQAFGELTAPPAVVSNPTPGQAPSAVAGLDNLILNGDFEFTTLPPDCHFNLSNAFATENISNITFWGEAAEVDLLNNGTGCTYFIPPQSGMASLAIHRQEFGLQDAFCFELASPVFEGVTYTASFYLMANTEFSPLIGSVEIGLSLDPTSFGTFIFSGSGNLTDWTYAEYTFVAPFTANYLCVQAGPDWAWNSVDNFSLDQATVPVSATHWETLKSYYR